MAGTVGGPMPLPHSPTVLERMGYLLTAMESGHILSKQIPEPVFGIIKWVTGFRIFSLWGLQQVRGEWNLVKLAWNVKRMFALMPA